MKKTTAVSIVFAWVFLVCVVSLFLGCEGEQGPTGPGADSSGSCGSCHDVSTSILAKQTQTATSGHGTGTSYLRSTSASCALCHSSEGFSMMVAGEEVTGIDAPTRQNCRTCHNIHKNYDETDYALATTAPVELTGTVYTGTTIDIGKGNLCSTCHQTRFRGYEEDGLVVGGGDYTNTSSHFGPHHGTQANYLTGNGGFEVPGTLAYTNSYHATGVEDGCVTCHVHEGDHTFEASEDACAVCHTDIDGIDEYRGVQDEFALLMTELETVLLADSLLAGDPGDTHPNTPITRSANKMGALMNFMGLVDDGSLGIHNTKYQRAMLQNSIEVFE